MHQDMSYFVDCLHFDKVVRVFLTFNFYNQLLYKKIYDQLLHTDEHFVRISLQIALLRNPTEQRQLRFSL